MASLDDVAFGGVQKVGRYVYALEEAAVGTVPTALPHLRTSTLIADSIMAT